MRFRAGLSVAVLLASAALFGQSAEETAIRGVLADQTAAWNRGDVRGFMRGYEDSSATTFIGERVIKGYGGVLERYLKRYGSPEKMGVLRFSDVEVRMLGADHAAVVGRFHLVRGEQGGGDAAGIFSLILRRTIEGWKIILDHTS